MRGGNNSGDELADNEGSLSNNEDLLDGAPSSWGAVGPDGGPMMQVVPPPMPAPPFDAKHCPCLRGPCRYLHQVKTHFEHGNSVDSISEQPKQRRLMCMGQQGVFLDMSADAPVLECSLWDPMIPEDVRARDERRRAYFKDHPEDVPDNDKEEADDVERTGDARARD